MLNNNVLAHVCLKSWFQHDRVPFHVTRGINDPLNWPFQTIELDMVIPLQVPPSLNHLFNFFLIILCGMP